MRSFLKPIHILLGLGIIFSVMGCSVLVGGQKDSIQASGVIETTEVAVSPAISGRVVQVMASEGDSVKSGDVLLQLDDTLLQAQRKVAAATLASAQSAVQSAQAALDSANAQYQVSLDAALAAERQARTDDWRASDSKDFTQPAWYFTRDEQVSAAQGEVAAAQAALQNAQSNLNSVIQGLGKADFLQAEKDLASARNTFDVANEVRQRAQDNAKQLQNAAKDAYDNAKKELDRAQQAYNKLLTTQAARDVLKARAEVSIAQECYETARDQLRTLQTGELAPQVVAAQKAAQQAQEALAQAQNGVTEAQANLGLVDAQIQQLSVPAPADGIVLARSIQPGEVIQAGTTAMSIGSLDNLKVTVYIPEDRYGQISLGGKAQLKVDSFPGQAFDAAVTRIASQAEYTPNNVQTKENRQTTVYAVELSITDPQGKLVPGMPADVTFQ